MRFEGGGILAESYRGQVIRQGRLVGAIRASRSGPAGSRRPRTCGLCERLPATSSGRGLVVSLVDGRGRSSAGMLEWDEDEALATWPAAEIVRGLEESWSVIKSGWNDGRPPISPRSSSRPKPDAARRAAGGARGVDRVAPGSATICKPRAARSRSSLGIPGVAGPRPLTPAVSRLGLAATKQPVGHPMGKILIGVVMEQRPQIMACAAGAMPRRSRSSSSRCSILRTGWRP